MIPCRFIFSFKNGGASASLNSIFQVHTVPRVGETIYLGSAGPSIVKEVEHAINPADGTHEIRVYYEESRAGSRNAQPRTRTARKKSRRSPTREDAP
ncbi:hypothetical protein [Polyangium fumosum]|uniref:Uncharacterized protein n=1 Tax=Polyangium fumosum TaxID=889272 RepID=A0A4U1IV63_9BACT|nr:hypothetical protein [Polyangium fumosum]TKC98284.1 hypothetical protein E8A74_41670 [Polyangium fumosum]